MAPKKVSVDVLAAYEALYNAIGDAAEKYSKVLAPVRKSARFQDSSNHPFTARFVRLDMQKIRNVLLPKFRPNAPIHGISDKDYTFTYKDFSNDGLYKMSFQQIASIKANYGTDEVPLIRKQKQVETKQMVLLKNVAKAAAAAEADFLEALAYYEKEEQVSLSVLPKTMQAYKTKVLNYFDKLQKKAAVGMTDSTKIIKAVEKKLKSKA